MVAPAIERELHSISSVCQQTGGTYREVMQAVDRLGLPPALSIDRRMYFDAATVARLRDHLRAEGEPT